MSSFTGAKAVDPRMSENKKTKDNIKPHEHLSFPITLILLKMLEIMPARFQLEHYQKELHLTNRNKPRMTSI